MKITENWKKIFCNNYIRSKSQSTFLHNNKWELSFRFGPLRLSQSWSIIIIFEIDFYTHQVFWGKGAQIGYGWPYRIFLGLEICIRCKLKIFFLLTNVFKNKSILTFAFGLLFLKTLKKTIFEVNYTASLYKCYPIIN